MRKLTVTAETFNKMILELIKSGVVFKAKEIDTEMIEIVFTGAY